MHTFLIYIRQRRADCDAKTIKLLSNAQINNIEGQYGTTALMEALLKCYTPKITRMLLNFGALANHLYIFGENLISMMLNAPLHMHERRRFIQ